MPKLFPLTHALYLWILGIAIGTIIALGVLVAPVIFKAALYLPELPLTKFQSGILMTQIFVKSTYILNFTAVAILVYEFASFKLGYTRPLFWLFGGISLMAILLFTLYYTPYIIEAQNLGAEATQSPAFASMHAQSEWVFKILLFSLSALFITRALRILSHR